MTANPVEVFPVGVHLLEELEAWGWSQAEFAEIIDRPAQVISEIIAGKKEITRESAAQIGAAMGQSPGYWLRLQDEYHLWRQEQDGVIQRQLDDVRLRALLNKRAPLGVLRKRGIISATTLRGQAEQLCQLLEIGSPEEIPSLPMAARRSNAAEGVSSTQVVWLACVRRLAKSQVVGSYSDRSLKVLAERLSREVRDPAGFADLPSRLAGAGVRLVYVEAFPGSKIDGASFQMDGIPVIGLSGRGHRLDKVLFTLLHEIAHIVLGHTDAGIVLDEGDLQGQRIEDEANRLAAEWVIPGVLPQPSERPSQAWLSRTASALGVHPIVVVGRLQNAGRLSWRSALAKDAPSVIRYMQQW
ncbi:HigA family addiction module antitoxin [Amycolatopsis sp. La24]|uniref:HigA family addiction module antitoxin n=1 Tax=Amycolatopsis sp. La24 TaxID=3028304 RepID=UPI0023B1BC85|nr:HigA family addiction module antitoxin [Amycolatopsis sp. La24]